MSAPLRSAPNLCRPLQAQAPCRSMAEEFPCLASINDSLGGSRGAVAHKSTGLTRTWTRQYPDKVSLPLGGGRTGTSLALRS